MISDNNDREVGAKNLVIFPVYMSNDKSKAKFPYI